MTILTPRELQERIKSEKKKTDSAKKAFVEKWVSISTGINPEVAKAQAEFLWKHLHEKADKNHEHCGLIG